MPWILHEDNFKKEYYFTNRRINIDYYTSYSMIPAVMKELYHFNMPATLWKNWIDSALAKLNPVE